MKRQAFWVLLAVAVAAATGGCVSTAIKEGSGVVLGAKGTFMPIQPLATDQDAKPLGVYRRFELGQLTDEIGGKVPPDLLGYLPAALQEQLRKAHLPDEPDGKTMLIRGRIIHYESAGTVGFALGPLEEVVVLTEFVDKDSGTVLGRANCIGRTTARVNAGVKKKAEGLAKAFVRWIEARFPKDQKVK
jgi:hypothetical protein